MINMHLNDCQMRCVLYDSNSKKKKKKYHWTICILISLKNEYLQSCIYLVHTPLCKLFAKTYYYLMSMFPAFIKVSHKPT